MSKLVLQNPALGLDFVEARFQKVQLALLVRLICLGRLQASAELRRFRTQALQLGVVAAVAVGDVLLGRVKRSQRFGQASVERIILFLQTKQFGFANAKAR
ncbi:MAG: hypothetical protein QM744_15235 [Mesorhizobium sp.]